jgi:eukaryotic-like serine/threonine-protein kinase
MTKEALETGQWIEDTYRIVRRIGEGGMGEVYEAAHARLSGRYAIKLLQREVASDPMFMARFQREAQVTSSLRHPNIVQVLDFRALPSGVPYIVMEFLDGVELAAEIERTGPMPLPRVQSLLDQIASGLAAAHEQGIVHRDLKPANLFLVVLPGSRSELVKIVDFGISKVRAADTQLTRTATIMGTPQYMAPEQAQGHGDRLDARADQFSLACIVYEMIAGHCAFTGDTIPTVLYQLVHVEAPPLAVNGELASPAIDAVIRRGMAKRSEDRYPGILDFARAFAAAVAGTAPPTEAGSAGASAAYDPTVFTDKGRPVTAAITAGAVGAATAPAGTSASLDVAAAKPSGQASGRPRHHRRILALGGIVLVAGAAALALSLRSPTHAPSPLPRPSAAASLPTPVAARLSAAAPASAPAASAAEQVNIEVADPPANLTVMVDGGEPRRPPISLAKGSGAHELVFQAPGYRSRTMRVDSGKDVVLVVSLKKLGRQGATVERSEPPDEAPASGAKERFKRSINHLKKVWWDN